MAVAITPEGADTVATSTDNPITFSAFDIGTESSDRIVALAINWRAQTGTTRTLSTVTIGGVSASLAHQQQVGAAEPVQRTEIWEAEVPTGTTADVVMTFNDTTSTNLGLSAFAITGAGSPASDDNGNTSNSAASISADYTIPVDGGAVFGGVNGDQAGGATWTNATEHQDANATTFRSGSAFRTTAGAVTVTYAGASAGEPHAISGAVWSVPGEVVADKYIAGSIFI